MAALQLNLGVSLTNILSMTTCIICTTPKPEAEFHPEHVFPSAIGGRLVVHNVCDQCNHTLGSAVDSSLTDHWLIQTRRMQLGISGNSGKVPNPLARGHLVGDPTYRLRDVVAGDGGPGKLIIERSVQRTKQADGSEMISIRLDESEAADLPALVNKILKRAGHDALPEADIEKHAVTHSINAEVEVSGVNIDLVEYKRGVLKIAYELACRWLGDAFLQEPAASDIRDCLLDPKETQISAALCGRIYFAGAEPQIPLPWGPNVHVGILLITNDHVALVVRIFDIIEAQITMSHQPSHYARVASMFVMNDSVSGDVREGRLEDEWRTPPANERCT
ncbi:HNH endonuclease [Gemmatimonas aurantiaca]|uniref:HNH endonuclease n=1 Tax=Gemmatimonas aurantiaca TaxID=173480 RepID=UPI00301BD110